MLRIQKYNLDVIYVPGRDMLLADNLSRAYLPESTPEEAEGETVNMVQHLPISSDRLHDIRSATEKDNTLQFLIKTMSQRWPKDKAQVPSEIRPYFSLQRELSHQDEIVFGGGACRAADYSHYIWVLKDVYAELESVSTGWAWTTRSKSI